MKPLDPRLVRYASAVRPFLALGAVLGVVQTALTVAFAFFVSRAVVVIVDHHSSGLAEYLVGLAVTVVLRSLVGWALEAVAARTSARVKSQLRRRVIEAVVARGHAWLASRNSARLATLVGPGLDALDDYFAKYLPQLILTALATPLLVIVMFSQDLLSGVIVLCTLPVIPLFMILIGWSTRSAQQRQWERLSSLASTFLDAVNGLSTLKAFGRDRRQIKRVGDITDDYRRETMKVLQVSFLSGFALEMAASLSVAIVAVTIGVRLVAGSLDLEVGLLLLLLAPEVYLPLRQVGAHFHAAADGVAAADDVFEILDDRADPDDREDLDREDLDGEDLDGADLIAGEDARVGSTPAVATASASPVSGTPVSAGPDVLEVRGLTVRYGDKLGLAPVDLDLPTGRVTAITGPSGIGKSSLLGALLGTVAHAGVARWHSSGTARSHAETAWSGQNPGLLSGTVASNVALGDEVDLDLVTDCLTTAGGSEIDRDAVLGAAGEGLSGGQAQRVALARALYRVRRRGARLLLVDEPTSALDSATEALLVEGLRSVAATGVAVVVVTHRPGVVAAADQVVDLGLSGRTGALAGARA